MCHISASLGAGEYHCQQGRCGHHAWAGRDLPQQLLQAPFASISPQECGAIHAAGLPTTMLVTWPDPWPWGHRLQLQRLLVLWPKNSALLSSPFFPFPPSLFPSSPLLSPALPSLFSLSFSCSCPSSRLLSVCLVSLSLTPLPCLLYLSEGCLSVSAPPAPGDGGVGLAPRWQPQALPLSLDPVSVGLSPLSFLRTPSSCFPFVPQPPSPPPWSPPPPPPPPPSETSKNVREKPSQPRSVGAWLDLHARLWAAWWYAPLRPSWQLLPLPTSLPTTPLWVTGP